MNDLLSKVKKSVTKASYPITGWQKREAYYWAAGEYEFKEDWQPFELGTTWSEAEEITTFFQTKFTVPAKLEGKKLRLHLDTGGEAAVSINGQLKHGQDRNHEFIPLSSDLAGQTITISIEAALDRINKIYAPDPDYEHRFSKAKLQVVNKEAEQFYYNLLALTELQQAAADREEAVAAEVANLKQELESKFKDGVDFKKLNQIYQTKINQLPTADNYQIACFGHAHIDVAWLWQFKETVRKCSRTFATAIELMKEYPEFQFIQSQPQLYQFVKEHYPDLYQEIKEQITDGQWQPEGGMWVEADTNLTSGESLVRQFLYGKQFLQEEFGFESKVCWLPDVFGYTGSLPQIMKLADIDYFMTSKISWNDTNDFPYSIFNWEGIDGSRVLTHVPRVVLPDTYNGEVTADKLLKVKENYDRQKEENTFEFKFGDSSNYFKQDRVIPDDQLIYIYGYGDGGGGVTTEFIEKLKRFNDLPYLPELKFSQPKEYFTRIDQERRERGIEYPTWRGELYLEYHRGTYTTQAEIKKQNKSLEVDLRTAEMLAALAGEHSQKEIQKLWQQIAINQFHDILPGTSITEVYEDVNEIYASVKKQVTKIINDNLAKLGQKLEFDQIAEQADYYLVWNSLGYQRTSEISLKWDEKKTPEVYELSSGQELKWDYRNNSIEVTVTVPPVGYRILKVTASSRYLPQPNLVNDRTVDNKFFSLEFGDQGNLKSIFDKQRDVELIPADKVANELQFFVDQPPRFEAWEQVAEFEEERITDEVELIDFQIQEYRQKKVVNLTRKFRQSTFKQEIILYHNKDRIDFKNEVEWLEREILVKAAFPVNINSDQARFEIAYGNLTRPTTNNTTYEKAQFEVPGHRWVDLAQPGLGISLLNDCKYGYDVKDNLIRLTLLKAPNYPDETADYGQHEFTYSLYSHDGVFYQSDLLKYAEELTTPLLIKECSPQKKDSAGKLGAKSFVQVKEGNSRLQVIKRAEDSDQHLVLRFYEPYGGQEQVTVDFVSDYKLETAEVVNLLERPLADTVEISDNQLVFTMKPFEIKTIKVKTEV